MEAEQVNPTTNVVHPSEIGKTYAHSISTKNITWIIDTGASNHMTRDSCTTNGSISPITWERSITLTNSLTLDTVLIVPSLEYNPLSVGQFTITLVCIVMFLPFFCVFYDILTREILIYCVRHDNLYYLKLTEKKKRGQS